jgi:solute carrier family 25 carnitine/acylcarnitine transporter 20/29
MIIKSAGYGGLYTGWRLHFVRDTLGTALYFAEYDVMRHLLGRKRDGTSSREGDGLVQGDVPDWAKGWLPKGLIPFLCGSLAGVTSWALIYPVDVSRSVFLLPSSLSCSSFSTEAHLHDRNKY